MKTAFQDFYGQYITLHNETASGNVRMKVRTMPSMNDVRHTPQEDCTVETDISLNENQARVLMHTLAAMLGIE